MSLKNPIRKFISCFLLAFALSGLPMQFVSSQEHGAIPTPAVKPKIDQLGQMEGVTVPDRSILAMFLFVQVITCVFVAIALTGHLSLPPKKKLP